MSVTWQQWNSVWRNSRNLKAGWMVATGIAALYFGVVRPYEAAIGINNSKATGLAGAQTESLGLWRQMRYLPQYHAQDQDHAGGVVGGVPGGVSHGRVGQMEVISASLAPAPPPAPSTEDRKIVRTSSLDLIVKEPGEVAEKIRALCESAGGFLVSSEIRGDQEVSGGSLTIRVPAARFDEVRTQIRKLGLRVENEKIEAEDVTRQYVDQTASLHNLRAEEEQYLLILKQAKTVKDTLDVSEKLSDVRGQIEQQQAEVETLSKQIETVAITVSLRTEAEARVLGLNWRPLYQMKLALRDGLDGLATYATSMMALVFFLPTIVLWLGTITLGGVLAWKTLRWVGRRWLGWKPVGVPAAGIPAEG
jgi:hypothetical protein